MLRTLSSHLEKSVVGGDAFDADEDGVIDNFYRLKGCDIGLTATYTVNQATSITMAGHYGKRRESAKEPSDFAPYRGWSVALARRVKTLNPNYRTSDDYLKSLFIPAILMGGTFESERYGGGASNCETGLRDRRSLTPFVEPEITPQAQFRIGVPIRRTVVFGGKTKTELAAAVQYAIRLNGVK